MGSLTKGAVVLVPFPFSDLSEQKLRPTVVLADAGRNDYILCQVTSNPYGDDRAVLLEEKDFSQGSLTKVSYARPDKLFTASSNLVVKTVGQLNNQALDKIIKVIVMLLK